MKSRERLAEVLGFCALVVMMLVFLAWRHAHQHAGLSADQMESLALARAWVDGFGLRLTPFSSVSPAPANLGWFGVQVAVLKAGLTPELWLPRISYVLMGLGLVTVSFRGVWVWQRPVRFEDALPALGLSLASATAEATALGSGASVWVLSLAIAAVMVGRSFTTGKVRWLVVTLGALCLISPAALWLVFVAAPVRWLGARVGGRTAVFETLRFLIAGLVVVGGVLAMRTVLLGPLPLEGLVASQAGLAQTLEFLVRQSRWFWAALAGTLVASVWSRFHLRGGGTLVAWVVMTVVLASWTPYPRALFLGCVPLLAMLIADGLAAAREGAARADPGSLRWLSWSAFVAMVGLLALASTASYGLGPIMAVSVPPIPRPEVRRALDERGVRQALVVWSDGAEAAALFPEARVVVVKTPSALIEDLLMSEGPPDVLDPRVPIHEMPRLTEVMKEGPGGMWWLSAQSPDEDLRCVDGRLSLLSTTPEQLAAQLEQDVSADQPQRALSRWRCALAALIDEQLPAPSLRQTLVNSFDTRSKLFEEQGRLELAARAAALTASVGDEDMKYRLRAERLRAAWLQAR